MKNILIVGLMLMLMVSSVSAFSFGELFQKVFRPQGQTLEVSPVPGPKLTEPVEKPGCDGMQMFQAEIDRNKADPAFQEAVALFKDGDHVIELKNTYEGSNWYTVTKDGNEISVKKGYCSESGQRYYTDLDVTQLRTQDKLKVMGNAVSYLAKVRGISVYQKIQLARIAAKA